MTPLESHVIIFPGKFSGFLSALGVIIIKVERVQRLAELNFNIK